MANVDKITITQNGKHLYPQTVNMVEDYGIQGDKTFGKSERQICMLDSKVAEEVKKLNGLCTKKFTGNLLTTGITYALLDEGQRFRVGTAEIEMIQIGKRCFPNCPLVKQGKPCALPKACGFAKVIKSGCVKVNDKIVKIV